MEKTASAKEEFAYLKYEQLLAEKYFVESCFSNKKDSPSARQQLINLMFKIKCK